MRFVEDHIQITDSERHYTDEGFLTVPARISRTGTQAYLASEMGLTDREPNSVVMVYRPEEEVFSDASMNSFANKPVTNNHPPELLNAKNAKRYSIGHAGPSVTRDGMFVKTDLFVTDEDTIKDIEAGKTELSNGYEADIDWTPGISPNGETYDAIQRNIRGNHIAIVERGRAGPACRVADNLPNLGDKVTMAKVTIDGVDYEVSDQAAQAVGKLQARLKDAEMETQEKDEELKKKEDEMEEVAKEATKTNDSLKAKLDDATSRIPDAKTLDSLVVERTTLVDNVRKLVPDIDWQGKDANTLRREVVSTLCPNIQMDSVSSEYIDARFDILLENTTGQSNSIDDAFVIQQSKVTDSREAEDDRPASVVARDKFAEESRNAWKPNEGVK